MSRGKKEFAFAWGKTNSFFLLFLFKELLKIYFFQTAPSEAEVTSER